MNPLNLADQALIDRLRTITPENGYLTDIGNRVHTGYLGALLEAEEVEYPLIVVQPDECPAPNPRGPGWLVGLGRKVVGAADPAGGLEALNNLYCDLLRCLVTPKSTPSAWGSPGLHSVTFKEMQQFLADSEVPKGTVVIPLQLHTFITGL
ncbi:hypothetical protein [Azotobacter salinestris]|uniref:hypothetical protein n=1 Tax=Azotobacter salinestris TaxID=69964 RepID=UPI0032DEB1A2